MSTNEHIGVHVGMDAHSRAVPDPEAAALIEHITTGKPIDPELLRRIRERGDKIRQETFEKHGLLDIAVPAIRELRGELPE